MIPREEDEAENKAIARIDNAYKKTIRFLRTALHTLPQDDDDHWTFKNCLKRVEKLHDEWKKLTPKPRMVLPKLTPQVDPKLSIKPEDSKYKWSNLKLGDQIGRGTEADVYKAHSNNHNDNDNDNDNDDPLVVKRLHQVQHTTDAWDLWSSFVPHPHVAKLLGVVHPDPARKQPWHGLVTKHYSHGAISDLLYGPDGPGSIKILLQVCHGLAHLHRQDLIHHDLACRNILITRTQRVVLTDFGLSVRLLDSNISTPTSKQDIPVEMYAPEVCLALRDSNQVPEVSARRDMWAFAVVIWELVMHARFNAEAKSPEVVREKVLDNTILPVEDVVKKVGISAPRIVVALIGCKEKNKNMRLTAEEARIVLGGTPWTPEYDEELLKIRAEDEGDD